ncbi:exo-alpha-sialidase [Roseovarius spongiae]|uniref:exo-alpha-sialidase n=1 Tax=Roseovarius spongiae TaxID=2320272 RepID=UPI00140D671F|nr:exo-alpha-sialidase [Roseovarius spongiae]
MTGAQIAILALAALSVGLGAWTVRRDAPPAWRFAAPVPLVAEGAPAFDTVLDYTAPAGQAHSPGVALGEGGFDILWFEGSQEAQADVDIFAASVTRGDGGWRVGAPRRRVTRAALGAAMEPPQLVVTLGNTIENENASGALYTTAVSVGGWAMASVADVRMGPEGPLGARKLNLSPLLNRSHLVKSPMVEYADGSHALPAYFEMGQMHGVLVRLDARGRVRDAARMDAPGLQPIQPMIVPQDATRAVAFLRDFDAARGRLLISRTTDGGRTWSRVRQTDIPSPSAPVAALSLGGARILAAMNDDPDAPGDLRLSLSEDAGETWRVLHRFRADEGALRYPMLRRLKDDSIVLAYSKGTKRGITAHVFNAAWALQQ